MRKKKNKTGSFFKSTPRELKAFLCGIGESEIKEHTIRIYNYPFEPATVFPEKEIKAEDITEIHLDQYPPTLMIGTELIFISREYADELEAFAKRNQIDLIKRASNWTWITEPFLDTEFNDEQKARTLDILKENGFSEKEVKALREEVGEQMYKYNFDTMLWEWVHLGLSDVLAAMRPCLDIKAFESFYWRAMEIEQRSL